MCIVLYNGISRSIASKSAVVAAILLPLRIMYTMRAISHQYCDIKIQLLLLVSPATNIPVFGATFLDGAAPKYIY